MITATVLGILETLINRALAADPNSAARLQPLQRQLLRLELTDWNASVDVIAEQHGLSLYPADRSQIPACSIHTDLASLLRAARQQKKARKQGVVGLTPGIEIHGQSHLAQALLQLIFKLDIDWEACLSQRIGEHASARIAQGARSVRNTLGQIHQELQQQTRDYLQHEAQLLPTANQVDDFCQQVNWLRDSVERLQARLDRLE